MILSLFFWQKFKNYEALDMEMSVCEIVQCIDKLKTKKEVGIAEIENEYIIATKHLLLDPY